MKIPYIATFKEQPDGLYRLTIIKPQPRAVAMKIINLVVDENEKQKLEKIRKVAAKVVKAAPRRKARKGG